MSCGGSASAERDHCDGIGVRDLTVDPTGAASAIDDSETACVSGDSLCPPRGISALDDCAYPVALLNDDNGGGGVLECVLSAAETVSDAAFVSGDLPALEVLLPRVGPLLPVVSSSWPSPCR